MADTFDLKTKIERAIYALILNAGLGTPDNVWPGMASRTDEDRTLPNTTIEAGEGREDVFMGNYRFERGTVCFYDRAANDPSSTNPQEAFLAASQRSTSIIYLLVQSDDQTTMDYSRRLLNAAGRALAVDLSNGANAAMKQAALNNADMTDFTLIYWRVVDYGVTREVKAEGGGLYFERELGFECLACNSNVD